MAVDPEKEHREGAGIDDAQTVSLASLEWERRILVETIEVRAVLGKVNKRGFCAWLLVSDISILL